LPVAKGVQSSVDPPSQIVLLPVIEQLGLGMTVTVMLQVLLQPLELVMVT